ncbi:MAG: DEAD/DEAH box helicase [Bdellovibrionales bacterium]
MNTFEDFGLSKALNTSLRKMDYKDPTPIQQQAIPLALQGKDILGSAQTGTGKTAAFSIPMVEHLMTSNDNSCALILTPTRELAKQVLDVVYQLLGPKSGINTAFIIGGEPYRKQFQQLERNPRIIVGTPGRINDHLEKGSIDLSRTNFLVLDETDRMLDMGFGVQLDRIVKHLPKQRQTLMFSATLPNGIVTISDKYLTNPERVSVGETNVVAVKIKQETIRIEQPDKYQELLVQLAERTGTIIIFIKTKYNAEKMAKKLQGEGHTADALHGDLRQHKRDKVMKGFRDKKFRILVATDIAARGLDVPHIEHVINYDLPQVAEDYIHRMGRTARAGAEGSAISFISSAEGRKWHAIEMLLDPEAAMHKYSEPERRKKGRGKPYRGRPESKKSGVKNGGGYKGKKDGFKKDAPKKDFNNDNAEKPKKKRKEKYVAKADRVNDGQSTDGSNKPKKPHFKKKNDVKFSDTPEGKFVSDRKPKKKKGTSNKPNSKAKPKKGKGTFSDGNAPMKRVKKKKSPQR